MVTMTSACIAAIAKIRLGNNMVPLSPFMHGVLGLPVGFMLVFRWNNAYERWWSGRTELGLLLMHAKNLGGSFCTWVAGSDQQLATRALALICALKECVADRLNGTILADGRVMLNETTLTTPLHPDDLEGLFAAENKVLYCIESLRKCIFKAHAQGLLPPPILGGMQNEDLFKIMEAYGECEKVVNQPPPGCIITHLKSTLMVYMCALPFILVHEVGVLGVVPTTAILSLALFGTEAAAEQIEQPFGNRPYHLPVRALIRANTRDMGQTSRPVLGFSGYVNSPRAQPSSFEIPTIGISANATGAEEEEDKALDAGTGAPLLYGSADAWHGDTAAPTGDATAGAGNERGGGGLFRNIGQKTSDANGGPASQGGPNGARTGTITVVQPATPMEGERLTLPWTSRDADDAASALGMEASEGERLGGDTANDLSANTSNLGQVFFAQTESKLNDLRRQTGFGVGAGKQANGGGGGGGGGSEGGVFSSDRGRRQSQNGGSSNGSSNGHAKGGLDPSAQPWTPKPYSPYSSGGDGGDGAKKAMPTWKTQTPIEVFGDNELGTWDGHGSVRSTSHRYHVGDKARRNVDSPNSKGNSERSANSASGSASAPGSPVRRGFDFGQFVPSPLGLAPAAMHGLDFGGGGFASKANGAPVSPARTSALGGGLARTSSLDRDALGGTAVGGSSSSSSGGGTAGGGFDFSNGSAAQSASTRTADTLFGTEAAGASRSVFAAGTATFAASSAGDSSSRDGSSSRGSRGASSSAGGSSGLERRRSLGLEGGSPTRSAADKSDKSGGGVNGGEHADSVRTWSGKDARRAASALSNSGLFSQQQAAASQSARKSAQRMARTQSVGNFARVSETEPSQSPGGGGPSSPGGGSSSRGDEDGSSSPGDGVVSNVVPRNASAASFLDADSSVRPTIWDVFGDDATPATNGGGGGGARANGANGATNGASVAERERRSSKKNRSREAYVDGAAAVEAAASTPRRHKSGKPPRWVN
uniref:Uncharacterized protein n=1 Tax=Micromonas pusilla TaxID=38833 RepID=A0A7S0KU32_MICPS